MRKSLLPLGIATAVAVVLIVLGTDSVPAALRAFFLAPLTNGFYFSSMLSTAALLLLSGTGVSIAFSAGSFNLGGEGQSYSGGLAAALVFLLASGSQSQGAGLLALLFILAILAAVVVSAFQGLLAAVLKTKLDIDPLISSFLLSAGLIPVMDSLIIGPLRDVNSNLLTMPRIPQGVRLPYIASLPKIHLGIFMALMFWLIVTLWYHHSRRGFELKISGANGNFARFAGLPVSGMMILALTLSASFHGIAGFIALTGVHGAAVLGFSSGIGWNGIAVSLVGGNRLKNLPLASLIFSYLISAGNAAMIFTDFSFELSTVIQATVFLLISVNFTIKTPPRLRSLRRAPASPEKTPGGSR